MAVYTSYVGNWRGDLEVSISYPNATQATITLLARIDRKGTGTLVNATYSCNLSGSHSASLSGYLNKAGWTSSGQVRQFSSYSVTVSRGYSTGTYSYSGKFKYNDGSTVSNWYSTGTLYAYVAAKPSYQISYNANNGTGAPGNSTKWHDENLTLSSTVPIRTGYTFAGWNTAADGSGTSYGIGGTYPAANNAAATLYAQWTKNTYQVSYNTNGGSGTMGNSTFTYDTPGTLTKNTLSRTDYFFAGWNTQANGSGITYADEASVLNLASTGIFPLYAMWKYQYVQPDISLPDAYRTDSNGDPDESGEYGKITAYVVPASQYTSLTETVYINTSVKVEYKRTGTDTYQSLGSIQTIGANTGPVLLTWTITNAIFEQSGQYEIVITAYVSNKTSSVNYAIIPLAEFIVDFDPAGESVGLFTLAAGGVIDNTTNEVIKIIHLNGDIGLILDDNDVGTTDASILSSLQCLNWSIDIDSNIGG